MSDLIDFCNNVMPARIAGFEEIEPSGAGAEWRSRIELRLHGLLKRNPNAEQWSAAYVIARRYGCHPGRTRWEATDTDDRGRCAGTFVFERTDDRG